MIDERALPYVLLGKRQKKSIGVLLVHGFTSSPAEMRFLANFLNRRGYTVLAVRLSGHGTTPEDCEQQSMTDWLNDVHDGYALLKNFCEKISIVGNSMGALLALCQSTVLNFEKVMITSAPIYLKQTNQLKKLPKREASGGQFYPKAKRTWEDVPENFLFDYPVMPLLSVYELLDLVTHTRCILKKVRTPLLVVQSERDHTVNPESAWHILQNVASSTKQLVWLKQSGHRVLLDCERERVFFAIEKFLSE